MARRAAFTLSLGSLRRIERRVLAGASQVFATGDASRAVVAEAGGLELDRVGVLPLPVDAEEFAPVDEPDWTARLERPTILFVGRANDPRKNVDLLLRAWPSILERHPGARLRLVGEPPRTPAPAGVDIRGRVESVAVELRQASLFVLPSWQEGFGIVAAEALASGVPVVSTPSGGPEELIRRSGGGVVLSSFGVDELSEVVLELLGDVATLTTMRAAGRTYVVREHSLARLCELLRVPLARGT
jgi:glycosyltransferase involved in cell wall biosynthesis